MMNSGTSQKRIFIDKDKCDGCKNCSVACMNAHRTDDGNVYTLNLSDPRNESRNFIKNDGNGGYSPIFCRHCDEPECVATCMSGALKKDEESGLVLYDRELCGKCFMCVMNCPYGVPKPDSATRTFVVKCDFCIDRTDGTGPSCVEACPKKSISVKEINKEASIA